MTTSAAAALLPKNGEKPSSVLLFPCITNIKCNYDRMGEDMIGVSTMEVADSMEMGDTREDGGGQFGTPDIRGIALTEESFEGTEFFSENYLLGGINY